MSKLEVVESWKCTDGTVFATKLEASRRQATIDLAEWYNQDLYGGDGSVLVCDLISWLQSNHIRVKAFYNAMEGK